MLENAFKNKKRRGKQPKQTKSKAKEMSAKQLAPERHKKQRTENVQIPEDAGFRGCRSHCMHSSRFEAFPIFGDFFLQDLLVKNYRQLSFQTEYHQQNGSPDKGHQLH